MANQSRTLFSYGCHTVVIGPNSKVASPDFPGPAARQSSGHGGLALFCRAAAATSCPSAAWATKRTAPTPKNRIGTMLGGEVLKVAAGLRTHVRRGERTSLRSLLGRA